MPVTREQLQHIAALAELAVDDAAAAELERQLTRILDYVRQLDTLETRDAAATDARVTPLRPDVPGGDPLVRAPQAFATEMKQGLFVVPRLGAMGGGEEEP